MAEDTSPFASSDPINDPFNEQVNFGPLLADQMALEPSDMRLSAESTSNDSTEGIPIPPTPADSDAEADLPRGARAQQFRQSRRLQVSSAIPALALIGLGALLFAAPVWLNASVLIGLVTAAIGISLLARFWLNGRRERGLCFFGLTIVLWSAFLSAVVARGLLLDRIWPILVMALGLALLCTFLFERIHERSVILPGIALIVAGTVAMLFTWPLLSADWLTATNALLSYWPVALITIAILLIPRVLSKRIE